MNTTLHVIYAETLLLDHLLLLWNTVVGGIWVVSEYTIIDLPVQLLV